MPQLTTAHNLTDRQINAMKRIADGQTVDGQTWIELMWMDIADTETDEHGNTYDTLTVKGYRLLRQIEVQNGV